MINETPIPSRMRHLRRDHRGYPWPFLMMADSIFTMDGQYKRVEL